ncbi:MAG: peptidase M48 [Candidatus Liptonbacteria bacterium RIFCSPLOWO2_01_FULL_52_25]|uniref:Peptidase M48 n=1 Tax=Candidatus Liptonbacteria bacterium RIFCSPLOWO2_01_FULL_52_25 TaxID=1798650 RepID=A0A1G2CIM6_9BACT|nr:MAG: peptidase M48 [Candidatus Liptonbacteria bacterium RIFCSPLOWO2_01_FULL_52_25]
MRPQKRFVVLLAMAAFFPFVGPLSAQDPAQGRDPQEEICGKKKDDVRCLENIGSRGVGGGLNTFSLEREMAFGKTLAQRVEQTVKLQDDPVVNEYINRVGQNIVRNSDSKVPFTIKVIDSDAVNAFALPGGFFYVNTGLILRADSEAELAGVMAHEIAHVAARHSTKRETRNQITQLATIPLILLGPGGMAGYGIYQGMGFGLPLAFLRFSRGDESTADLLGLEYMFLTGYDPNAFVTFFEKVQAEEKKRPGTIPTVFNTHPPTPDRIEKAQKDIAEILPPRDQYIVTTSTFDVVKARLVGIENRNKLTETKEDKPTLRKRTGNEPVSSPQTPAPPQEPAEDERPRLERRPEDPQ